MKTLLPYFSAVILLLAFVPNAFSGSVQQESSGEPPLIVSHVRTDERAGRAYRLTLSFTNQSLKGISDMVLVFIPDHPDPEASKFLQRTTLLGRSIPTSTAEAHAPGSTWEHTFSMGRSAYKQVPHLGSWRVLIDFVLFDDGSGWGERKTYQHLRLAGMHHGALRENRRLRRVLEDQGVEALLEELAMPIPQSLRVGQSIKQVIAAQAKNSGNQ